LAATLYTIGHSNHAMVRFADLLRGATIERLADVRSTPFSRRNPQFSQKALAASLKDVGIDYWFLGDALGARPKDPALYDGDHVSFPRIAASTTFKDAIDALIENSAAHRIAIMCAEKEPLECHRLLLVGRALAERGADLRHILADGRIEPHAQTEDRLLHLAKEQVDLLGDRATALDRAYDKRTQRMTHAAE
jgi:uncharacterized protein (DUF488 family)